ncbi:MULTISPECIES: hypothetical protein [Campylobacter]|uniref:hypothetical protein n=1 Tax=Campylobacter TaxID=194 RepID=UPI00054DCACB|nr:MULTISPECIES: hypothetical protein [Campylobacter]OCS25472.1 hypothetical protein CFVB10_08235 [Campylobacter fetus subsp. venerealis cfvB10]MBC3781076.1 hypothetical protein [Campylobacter fetus subsp. fetus]MBC3782799.1 hypothetical protein [Campylobacter fetus subsp. venerealis]OCS28211.1 hypothetical protein CFV33872_04390 [Campylobacter fetus subsp. venerealis CCUG 33872]OCS35236.1 hypothetical protein AWR32_08105 [Campylobacter fetus subsp. venerealis]
MPSNETDKNTKEEAMSEQIANEIEQTTSDYSSDQQNNDEENIHNQRMNSNVAMAIVNNKKLSEENSRLKSDLQNAKETIEMLQSEIDKIAKDNSKKDQVVSMSELIRKGIQTAKDNNLEILFDYKEVDSEFQSEFKKLESYENIRFNESSSKEEIKSAEDSIKKSIENLQAKLKVLFLLLQSPSTIELFKISNDATIINKLKTELDISMRAINDLTTRYSEFGQEIKGFINDKDSISEQFLNLLKDWENHINSIGSDIKEKFNKQKSIVADNFDVITSNLNAELDKRLQEEISNNKQIFEAINKQRLTIKTDIDTALKAISTELNHLTEQFRNFINKNKLIESLENAKKATDESVTKLENSVSKVQKDLDNALIKFNKGVENVNSKYKIYLLVYVATTLSFGVVVGFLMGKSTGLF